MTYKLRWTDNKGIEQFKIFQDESRARKAMKWLKDNGCDSVDVAIVMPVKTAE